MTEIKPLPEWLKKEMKLMIKTKNGWRNTGVKKYNQGLVRAWELTQERITEIKAMMISYLKDGDMENDEKEYAILKHIDKVFK